jgi:hypothetical protein
VTPTLSVEAAHLRLTLVSLEATAVRFVGAVGAVVSAGVLSEELDDPQPLPQKTIDKIIANSI